MIWFEQGGTQLSLDPHAIGTMKRIVGSNLLT